MSNTIKMDTCDYCETTQMCEWVGPHGGVIARCVDGASCLVRQNLGAMDICATCGTFCWEADFCPASYQPWPSEPDSGLAPCLGTPVGQDLAPELGGTRALTFQCDDCGSDQPCRQLPPGLSVRRYVCLDEAACVDRQLPF